jgi:N,N'-diacetyl-8-epilegionaminate cytidylyltransferase
MSTFGFVFARGGSKGVPGKNIRDLAGKPLLAHALHVASQVTEIERVFVSTDSSDIAAIAESFGATSILRPTELAQDDSPEWLAWRHAINWVKTEVGNFEIFVSLPATAPLRAAEDVTQCLSKLDQDTDIVLTMTPSQRSPWFNMVKTDTSGQLSLLVGRDEIVRRQDAPVGYDLTTVAYVSRPQFILEKARIWDGRVRGVVVPQERAIDIDTELDFEIADFLMRKRQENDR